MLEIHLDEIRELTLLLKKANVNKLEIFSGEDFGNNKNIMTKMFNALASNEIKDVKHLKEYLNIISNSPESSFYKLYYRFREKLINTLFFIDTNSSLFTDRSKAYYVCSKRAVLVRMISNLGLKELALSIAVSTLNITLKYEFTELTLLLSKIIISQIGILNKKDKNILKYKLIYKKAVDVYFKELSVAEKCFELSAYLNSTHKLVNNPVKSHEFERIVKKAYQYIEQEPSIELLKYCSILILNYNKENRQFGNYKDNTFLFLKRIMEKPFMSSNTLENIISELLKVLLITKDLKTVYKIKSNYFKYLNSNEFNWFVIQIEYIHTLFHCKDYQNCWNELSILFSNKILKRQPQIILQNSYILQAYAHFLYKIGKIKGVTPDREFRINKFLNEVPEYSKDKQGVNIPIILIQILFFLADHKHHLIIDRMDSLKLYAYRYLKKDENFRSQCFIRMLGEIVRAGFKRQGTVFRTKALTDKLKLVPIDTYPATAENEIIPYEDLWEMVLGLLK